MKCSMASAIVLVVVAVLCSSVAADQPAKASGAELAKQRIDAAAAVCKAAEERMNAGEPLTPSFIDLYVSYLRQLAEARANVAVDDVNRVAAWTEYKNSCTRLVGRLMAPDAPDVAKLTENIARYAEIDANHRLALMTK